MLRVPTVEMGERMVGRLDQIAEHCAAMTGCRVERHWVSKSRPGLANHAMADLVWQAMQAIGPPQWSEEGLEAARAVQSACGVEPMASPLIDACHRLIDPCEAETLLRRDLPPSQHHSTSDDYTDMCWHAPTARFYLARPALKGGPYPPWAMNALGGIPETIDPMVETAASILALSALRLLEDAAARKAAMEEFEHRRAEAPIPPLCDYAPPIGFPWPEYVETARGRDWHIPSSSQPR